MKKVIAGLCVGATMAAASGAAFAGDDGWYVLGAIGQKTSNDKATLDNALIAAGKIGFTSSLSKPNVYKLQVGYQLNKNLAIEGGYLATGSETYTASGGNLAGPVTASAKVTGWNLNAVGILPVASQFSLLGKLGVADLRSPATATGPGGTFSASTSKTDMTYGIGAKYDFTNAISARLDLDSYKVGTRGTVWMVGLGYKF